MNAPGGALPPRVPGWFHSRFPKQRTPLPAAYRAIFLDEYRRNRGIDRPAGLKERLEGWMHRHVAAAGGRAGPVLELGAGGLNHLAWEPAGEAYEIVEPFVDLYAGRPETNRVRRAYADIGEIPEAMRYRRIISIATLEHVLDLPVLVARSALLLAADGTFAAGIPTEGGAAWYLAWRLGTGVSFWWRTGLDYGPLMRYEHVNTAREVLDVTSAFFERVVVSRFPAPWHHASLYLALEATGPRHGVARHFLDERPGVADD
jgi:hypothetical protein